MPGVPTWGVMRTKVGVAAGVPGAGVVPGGVVRGGLVEGGVLTPPGTVPGLGGAVEPGVETTPPGGLVAVTGGFAVLGVADFGALFEPPLQPATMKEKSIRDAVTARRPRRGCDRSMKACLSLETTR